MSPSLGQVLIVDDEPRVAAMLRDVAVDLGYAARVVANGPAALRAVPVYHPDVVLLDLTMPDMSGAVVLERLREMDARLPVVIVTGNNDVEVARGLLARGAFDYVSKPFNLEALARILAAALVSRG